MKKYLYLKTVLFYFIGLTINSRAQQQFTHTAAKENISCNYDCTILDIPELNNNPLAILFISPVSEKGVILNQHPIGAYYFKEKWHIFNLDSRPIPVGAKFTVTYFTSPDEKHFQYSFRREDIQADGSALIDHPSLNNKPSAKFTSFPRWDPNSQGGVTNRDEIKTEYNAAAGKWAFSNKNQKQLFARVTYNISVETAGNAAVLPVIDTPRISQPLQPIPTAGTATTTPNTNAITGDITAVLMAAWVGTTKLMGDNKMTAFPDHTELWGLEMATTNFSARKNTYEPITIRFHSGTAMMMQLLNAYINKQSMTFQLDALTVNGNTSKLSVNYTIKLTGATISSYRQVFFMDPSQGGGSGKITNAAKTYEEIKVTFTQIQFTNSAGATATDNF